MFFNDHSRVELRDVNYVQHGAFYDAFDGHLFILTIIHPKSKNVCGLHFSVQKNLRKKCVNSHDKILQQKCVNFRNSIMFYKKRAYNHLLTVKTMSG